MGGLSCRFSPKHPLTFRPDGIIRMLMMSDLQESVSYGMPVWATVATASMKDGGGRLFIYREDQPETVTTHMIRTLDKV